MRIREILFRDFRSFRGEKRISFCNPLTDVPLELVTLSGTSGTGKTTILNTIFEIGDWLVAVNNWQSHQHPTLSDASEHGFVRALIDVSDNLPSQSDMVIELLVGRQDLAGNLLENPNPNRVTYLTRPDSTEANWQFGGPIANQLQQLGNNIRAGKQEPTGGALYFPSNRRLLPIPAGAVTPTEDKFAWAVRLDPSQAWTGSLEHFWVGQNYLDLEAQQRGEQSNNLPTFISTVQNALGDNRKITIHRGRVQVQTPWANESTNGTGNVLIDQLPSGEQQMLFVLGELARYRRDHAIILVDEPELSLHPTLQRLMLSSLRKFAQEMQCQLILATHSLEIVRGVRQTNRLMLDRLADKNTLTTGDEDEQLPDSG